MAQGEPWIVLPEGLFFPSFLWKEVPRKGNAIKLSGRTFLAPHRGSYPKG